MEIFMKKHVFKLMTTVMIVMAISFIVPVLPASADALVVPNNNFYERNSDKMEYLGRRFYANGEAGYITLLLEPNSSREVISIENGEIIQIMFTFNDNGVKWGITELYSPDLSYRDIPTGWVKMDQLYAVYDSNAFIDANTDRIHEREYDLSKMELDGDIIFWTWPGSGEISGIWKDLEIIESNMNIIYTIYIDNEGCEWGYLPYFYGWREVWICLDDLSGRDKPAFNPAPEPQLRSPEPPPPPNTAGSIFSSPMFAITLVSLVAALSLLLIHLFWKKKK